jgi:Tat protein secretion system quality control protein TatD with DNase activity
VLSKLSELYEISEIEIAKATTKNAIKIFNL